MSESQNTSARYDIEDRTFSFAKKIRDFVKELPKGIANLEYKRQLIRSSGSVGANYIEANEALSKKDFLMRIKISRKEAKESGYWLKLLEVGEDKILELERQKLLTESVEPMKIFGSILNKS